MTRFSSLLNSSCSLRTRLLSLLVERLRLVFWGITRKDPVWVQFRARHPGTSHLLLGSPARTAECHFARMRVKLPTFACHGRSLGGFERKLSQDNCRRPSRLSTTARFSCLYVPVTFAVVSSSFFDTFLPGCTFHKWGRTPTTKPATSTSRRQSGVTPLAERARPFRLGSSWIGRSVSERKKCGHEVPTLHRQRKPTSL
jgi:hypothetical protein